MDEKKFLETTQRVFQRLAVQNNIYENSEINLLCDSQWLLCGNDPKSQETAKHYLEINNVPVYKAEYNLANSSLPENEALIVRGQIADYCRQGNGIVIASPNVFMQVKNVGLGVSYGLSPSFFDDILHGVVNRSNETANNRNFISKHVYNDSIRYFYHQQMPSQIDSIIVHSEDFEAVIYAIYASMMIFIDHVGDVDIKVIPGNVKQPGLEIIQNVFSKPLGEIRTDFEERHLKNKKTLFILPQHRSWEIMKYPNLQVKAYCIPETFETASRQYGFWRSMLDFSRSFPLLTGLSASELSDWKAILRKKVLTETPRADFQKLKENAVWHKEKYLNLFRAYISNFP